MRKILLAAAIVAALCLAGAWWLFAYHAAPRANEGGVCTMEALLCPDGSGVGRSGAQCEFAACPNQDSFTGKLLRNSTGFRLIIASPPGIPGATYALPLSVDPSVELNALVGQTVTVHGLFKQGNQLMVVNFSKASATDYGAAGNQGAIRVGETKLIDGVKVTLLAVTADSRCPKDVQCIQAGSVTAHVTLTSDTDHETLDMRSGAAPHPFDSFQVSIANVSPSKVSTAQIDPASYIITFQVDPL